VLNRRFADAVVAEAEVEDPIILVQDYHFALLPALLRERLPRATILTFWHIPWPNAERFGICPWERRLLEGLLGSSIIGFHTQAHCNNFLESVDRFLEARIDRERHSVVKGGRNLEREELSDDLLAQIFDVFIRDLSGFALQLFGKPSSTPAQMALCQRMIRKPAPDAARAERVFVEHVLSQKDAYEMRP
jgi:hypothetical protein